MWPDTKQSFCYLLKVDCFPTTAQPKVVYSSYTTLTNYHNLLANIQHIAVFICLMLCNFPKTGQLLLSLMLQKLQKVIPSLASQPPPPSLEVSKMKKCREITKHKLWRPLPNILNKHLFIENLTMLRIIRFSYYMLNNSTFLNIYFQTICQTCPCE